MTSPAEDWSRVKGLFDGPVALDARERPVYLARVCGDDRELRRQVEALLASHDHAQTFLETPAGALIERRAAADDLVGRTVASYRIEARIGAGGMGEVYRAHDTKLDRPVAVKLLAADVARNPERLRRFRAEARAASSLNHPHILVIHDFGELDARPFIVTELVEGQTLRQQLEAGPMAVHDAIDIAMQVASALSAAHARGIVHRDIKPENIMVRPDGYVKVLDFGVAKLMAPPTAESGVESMLRTEPGMVIGTPRYMSPEQVRGLDVDPRSDIWSVGVTLYEMVAGCPPFAAATTADLVSAILHSEPAPLGPGVSDDGGGVGGILVRALRKNPLERYPDTRELINDLTALKRRIESGELGSVAARTTAGANNFPLHFTAFIGREDDIEGIGRALGTSRLVTLTGAGGVGKTRLALQVGARLLADFPDGAWLVDLAPVSDPALVGATVAAVLGVRDRPGRSVVDSLWNHLRRRSLLIVLDNCEHLVDACAALAHQVLAAGAGVKLLATSREALNVPGEASWKVRSLGVPDAGAAVDAGAFARAESVQLFAQRAQAARPGFEVTLENAAAVAQICRRLDGLPLAIELAAARVSAMSPVELAERLDDRFRLLTGGSRMALPRQRTLEATMSWSYDLLSEPERRLFDGLTVFAGGWTLEAAERVCLSRANDVADLLARLVDRSLVVPNDTADGHSRYRMLETLRHFGRDRLIASGDTTGLRNRHLAWAVALAEGSPPQTGPLPPPEIAAETDNLRVALEWACDTGAYESGLRISGATWIGSLNERRRILTRLLPFADQVPVDVQGKALFAAGGLAFMIGDWAWGVEAMNAAAEVNAKIGNVLMTSMSLTYAGACYWGLRDLDAARGKVEEGFAAARKAGNVDALARALLLRTWLETERDLGQAEALAIEGEAAASKLKTVFDRGHIREVHAFIHCLKGDFERGAEALAETLTIFEDIQINCASHVLETTAAWAAMTARFELGAEILGSAHRIREETGDKPRPWERAVQDVWLPKIADSLEPIIFDTAHRRGAQRPFLDALDFARRGLRAAVADRRT